MKIFWIDLFSGAGGTTTGIHLAGAKVVACVNHDALAIESHKANHPDCLHFVEDVRDWNVVVTLRKLVKQLRKKHPGCIINLWASLECTNYSKAKGGQPRDADSRTLAHALFMYIEELSPDYIFIENVREFMSWGPLDKNGRPVSRLNGQDYIKWTNKVQSYGYRYDWQLLNAADFGAYTSRQRYFGQFAKTGMPIVWPETTHVKKLVTDGLFPSKKKWKAVREVLDLNDEGKSIFQRKKPLSENTLKRIYAGLLKFVAGGEKEFIKRYNGGNPAHKSISTKQPIGTITTNNRFAVVKCAFLKKYYSGNPQGKITSLNNPAGAITTIDHHALIQSTMLTSYYGNGGAHGINEPCPTITTKDRFSCVFIDHQYGKGIAKGINEPAGTITQVPKQNLVSVSHYLINPSWGGHSSSINKPSPVIIARQDKAPMYIVGIDQGKPFTVSISPNDSPTMKQIKKFMALYGIIDIKMRMLRVDELLRIQGFPEDYKLKGSKTAQKKFIGNAVVPLIAQKITEANTQALTQLKQIAI